MPGSYWKKQERLWFPVLRESGFTRPNLLTRLREKLPPDLRPVEGIHALGIQDGRRSLLALRSLNHETDDYWRRVYQRQVCFGFSRSRGTPAEWSEFFGHGLGTRYYGYGWRSEKDDALDVWAIIDIEVLNQLGEKGVRRPPGGRATGERSHSWRTICGSCARPPSLRSWCRTTRRGIRR